MQIMNNSNEIQFRCTISYMFKNCPKQDGWFGCYARTKDGTDIKLTGKTLVPLTKGMQLDVTVAKVSNGTVPEFKASNITVVTRTITGTKAYLKSLPGVSDTVADKLVRKFGADAIEMIRKSSDKVESQLGLSKKQMSALVNGITNTNEVNKLRTFLPELYTDAINYIKNTMQPNPIEKIKKNPWILMDCPHTSFMVVDMIAVRLGINPFATDRIKRGILYILQSEQNGDSYINLTDDNTMLSFMRKVQNLLKLKFENGMAEFGKILMDMTNEESPVIHIEQYGHEYHLYTIEDWYDYGLVLKHLNQNRKKLYLMTKADTDVLKKVMDKQELLLPFKLTDEQRYASIIALSHRISIITGGPGRGKTLTIGFIAACSGDLNKELMTAAMMVHQNPVLLLAPTGKAAKKLQIDTNDKYPTMTIDRLLCAIKFEQKPDVSGKKKKPKGYFSSFNKPSTLIIVDESSMVDMPKIGALFSYFDKARFCFVGDKDQLPPVGKGQFFHDIIRSGKITTAYLTIPMRHSGLILENADKINAGNINLQYDVHEMPFYPQAADDYNMIDTIIDQYNDERIIEPDASQIAVICPVQQGIIGVVNINIAFQEIMCPKNDTCIASFNTKHKTSIFATKGYQIPNTFYGNYGSKDGNKHTSFRIGDIVMCTKSNYKIHITEYDNDDYLNGCVIDGSNGIFNGEVGRIIGYIPDHVIENDTDSDFIIVQFNNGYVAELDRSQGEFDNFVLGYAMTVHKVQGCEYNTVIYVSPQRLMTLRVEGFACKNLVYTAITRAKKRAVIIGSKESLNKCIQTDMAHRNSTLSESII